jgi:hypothetical protein
MNYIGVDLHKDNMTVVGVNEKGEIFVKERIAPKCIGKIDEFFSQQFLHPCKLVCESIGFYHWFYDLVSPKVEQFILANPIETKKYSWNNPKTDFKDATKLAFLLAGGEFERNKALSCYIPDKIERTFREKLQKQDFIWLEEKLLSLIVQEESSLKIIWPDLKYLIILHFVSLLISMEISLMKCIENSFICWLKISSTLKNKFLKLKGIFINFSLWKDLKILIKFLLQFPGSVIW